MSNNYINNEYLKTAKHLRAGDIAETAGKDTPGDGNGGTFVIFEDGRTADDDMVLDMGNNKRAVKVNTHSIDSGSSQSQLNTWGLVADAKEITFSISGNRVTASEPVFSPLDAGKKLYGEKMYDLSSILEGATDYDKAFSNYTSLLASATNLKLSRADDISDDPDAIAPGTGKGYYFVRTIPYRYEHMVDHTVNITGYVSPTEVDIDYTAPAPITGISGRFGTDNTPMWVDMINTIKDQKKSIVELSGDYFFYLEYSADYSFTFSNIGARVTIKGTGKETTNLYWYQEADLLQDDNLLAEPGGPLGFLWRVAATAIEDESYTEFLDIGIHTNKNGSFRHRGRMRRYLFVEQLGCGTTTLRNTCWTGASDMMYVGGKRHFNVDGILIDMLGKGEVCFSHRGAIFRVNNFHVKGCGRYNKYKSWISGDDDGRGFYATPEQSFSYTNGIFENTNGLSQVYGSGIDRLDDKATFQTIENVQFISNEPDRTCNGVYSGRTENGLNIINCVFKTEDAATGGRGVLIGGSVNVVNCRFLNRMAFSGYLSNVGTNNVNATFYEHRVFIKNCRLIESAIQVYNTRDAVGDFSVYYEDCYFQKSSGNIVQVVPSSLASSTGLYKSTATFRKCIFDGPPQSLSRIVFCESMHQNEVINFIECELRVETILAGECHLIDRLRDKLIVNIINCYSPHKVRLNHEAHSVGDPENKIFGYGNNFENGIIYATHDNTKRQKIKPREAVHSATLDTAVSVLVSVLNANEFNVTGTDPITRFLFSASDMQQYIYDGYIRVNALTDLTFQTGDNIANSFNVAQGGTVLFYYDSDSLTFRPVSGFGLT